MYIDNIILNEILETRKPKIDYNHIFKDYKNQKYQYTFFLIEKDFFSKKTVITRHITAKKMLEIAINRADNRPLNTFNLTVAKNFNNKTIVKGLKTDILAITQEKAEKIYYLEIENSKNVFDFLKTIKN